MEFENHEIAYVDSAYREHMAGFMQRRLEEIAELKKLITVGDFESIRKICHRLHGLGGTFGFHKISSIAESMRLASHREDASEAQKLIDTLERYVATVKVSYVSVR